MIISYVYFAWVLVIYNTYIFPKTVINILCLLKTYIHRVIDLFVFGGFLVGSKMSNNITFTKLKVSYSLILFININY